MECREKIVKDFIFTWHLFSFFLFHFINIVSVFPYKEMFFYRYGTRSEKISLFYQIYYRKNFKKKNRLTNHSGIRVFSRQYDLSIGSHPLLLTPLFRGIGFLFLEKKMSRMKYS